MESAVTMWNSRIYPIVTKIIGSCCIKEFKYVVYYAFN